MILRHNYVNKWIDGINALIRPFTTVFWIIVYPSMSTYLISKGVIATDPLALLSPYTQTIIEHIIGFWFTDLVVRKKRG
ncbi:hypothetical protein [Candidatus Liberibacter brunswickensis]|uniref:hypothetical protein n=1 Tax=Candidatus Liberibacter brunswickensis TaxID=1968796 RepID=UPI002FE23B57